MEFLHPSPAADTVFLISENQLIQIALWIHVVSPPYAAYFTVYEAVRRI